MKDKEKQILIDFRLKQAEEALEDADLLLSSSGKTQGSVNRAYYAMFYSVLALLQDIGKVPRKHSGAISLFDLEFVKTGIFAKELSSHLHKAFELRQVSDYHVFKTVDYKTAEDLITHSRNFVSSVSDYFKAKYSDKQDISGCNHTR